VGAFSNHGLSKIEGSFGGGLHLRLAKNLQIHQTNLPRVWVVFDIIDFAHERVIHEAKGF